MCASGFESSRSRFLSTGIKAALSNLRCTRCLYSLMVFQLVFNEPADTIEGGFKKMLRLKGDEVGEEDLVCLWTIQTI